MASSWAHLLTTVRLSARCEKCNVMRYKPLASINHHWLFHCLYPNMSTADSTTSSLDSVVTDFYLSGPWIEVKDNHCMVHLHQKFWGAALMPQELTLSTSEYANIPGFILSLDNPIVPFPSRSIWVRVSLFTSGHGPVTTHCS
jgi:hypothetical protein